MSKYNIIQYSEYLKGIINEIQKPEACYGKQGLILFYLYKYKIYSLQEDYDYYNVLIEDCINELIENNDFIGIVEFLYLSLLYKEEFQAEYDLSEIIEEFEKIAYSYMLGCFQRNDLDGYAGAGYPMNYFLLKPNKNEDLIKLFRSFIKKNIINNDKISYIKLNDDTKAFDLGITHGLSFIIKLYVDFFNRGDLNEDDLVILNRFINYIKENYKAFVVKDQACNIVYGCLGILYCLLMYRSAFQDAQTDIIISDILQYLSENRQNIWSLNNNTLMYGNSGIILFYNIISDKIAPEFYKDVVFWNANIDKVLNDNLTMESYSLAEGKIGLFITYMSQMINDYRFMNLFFINKI
ncbi:hypothetical protein OK18_07965 [Chryseobacterium gallinarum]|uniref:Lanthionine synthetase C family protein n=1 Tax=Chryseobacterium gallinarum TaxID=1324352 RepID=A0A0G3M097_CHRGL|nr:lanthionine synthetase LanC family protein [Chryseobacterium gallinarum]AKK72571.1 hypothetical protein OK18_07965 [Chryseobacterium gallinarum]